MLLCGIILLQGGEDDHLLALSTTGFRVFKMVVFTWLNPCGPRKGEGTREDHRDNDLRL